jgi:hypothetical protein
MKPVDVKADTTCVGMPSTTNALPKMVNARWARRESYF